LTTIFQNPQLAQLVKILRENNLPIDDLAELDLANFFWCKEKNQCIGVIGLEVHGSDGLLRSLAVASEYQGSGVGSALVKKLENHARTVGVTDLYLLTETAEAYFQLKGYKTIPRDLASENVKQSKEFAELCPADAKLMRKSIK